MLSMNMKRKKLDFSQKLGILCIFSVFLDKAIRGGGFTFDFYYYYPVFLLFLLSLLRTHGKISLPPSWFNKAVGIVFLCGLIVASYKNILGYEYLKQVLGISFSALVYYNVLVVFRFDIQYIFEVYLKFAFWVALHGVVDNILHIAGIHMTNYSIDGPFRIREYGIMGEPFYLAMALTPAIVYYTCYFKRTYEQSKFTYLILLLCYMVTYSSTAVFGFVMAVLCSLYINDFFSLRNSRLIMAPVLLGALLLFISYLIENVTLINKRYNDTTSLFFSSEIDVEEAGKSNSSTFALYSNYVIARDSFLDNPLFGSGLGSHPIIYERTFLKYFPPNYLKGYGAQNKQDANSRFLRLMSETGLVGLVIFFAGLIAFFAGKKWIVNLPTKELASINMAIFVYIILGLIRNGNYINVGFFLFLFMYFSSYKQLQHYYENRLKRSKRSSPGFSTNALA